MNRYICLSIISLLVISGFLFSCDDQEKYSTNPSHHLLFSNDTIHFDTIFTTIGSSTRVLKVYNRNEENLKLSSVRLVGSEQSGFRVNVDGHSGREFNDLEIRSNDSMYIFVEVKVDPQDKANPILIKDSLIFQMTNGIQQDVKLLAYGQDVLKLHGKVIDKDTVFNSLRPILVYDSLRVNEGVTLTIEPGTRLYFHDKIYCHIYGTLKVNGTLWEPVVFRGDRMDWLLNINYDRIAGQWGGIHFYESSYDNHLQYADIHSGDYGIRCDSSDIDRMKLKLENSIVHNMRGDCLNFTHSKVLVGNCQITNARKNCVSLTGGDNEFIHCTIASFYLGLNNHDLPREGVAVYLRNTEENPLIKADFRNCLITGSGQDEIQGVKNESSDFNYLFSYSLVNTVLNEKDEDYGEQLSHYKGVMWDDKKDEKGRSLSKDKNFLYIDSKERYYDFGPDSLSAAINMALYEDAQNYYPIDLQGRYRLMDGFPDAGCYEWMEGDGKVE